MTPNRVLRIGVLMAALLALFALVVPQEASAQGGFACFGDIEDFEGGFPPSGWTVSNNYSGSPVVWDTNVANPAGPWSNYTGGSGNCAMACSFCHYIQNSYMEPYDTSLYSPEFNLDLPLRDVELEFGMDFYRWTETFDVDWTAPGMGWTNLARWTTSQYGPYTANVDMSGAIGLDDVQLRFRYYNLSIFDDYDYWIQVDDVELICQASFPQFEGIPWVYGDPANLPCILGEAILEFTLTNTGDEDLVDLPGQPEFYVVIDTEGGAPTQVTSISSGSAGAGTIPGDDPFMGTAATASLSIPEGGTDTVTVRVTFPRGIAGVGDGLLVERGVWYDFDRDREVDTSPPELTVFMDEEPVAFECETQMRPNSQLAKQVHLPILNFQGMDDVCRTWIEVQNIGGEYKKAILVTWGEPGFCPPQCAGPLKVECSGLLKPGSTWNFLGAQVPTGSKSGMLFQFTSKQLLEVGVDLGFDDVVADLMCETLFFGVVGDCDDYRRFKKAYNEEGSFAGIPMNNAVKGDGYLAVDVLRHCPGDVTPGVEVSSKYNGIGGEHLGMFDGTFGGYAYYAPLLYADKAGFNSVMYIQNGGLECTSVEIWFKAQDDCLRARICEIFTLAPGESYQYDATDCVGPDWQGSAWLRSTQPLGIVVDIIGRDVLMTYIGEPAQLNYTFDPDAADFTPGNQVAYGPLIYSEYQGWDSGIQVQNLSSVTAAKVKVYFLDRSGDVITTLVDWICPRGSQTFFLPVVHNMPGNWVGSARVESQEWWTPGDPLVLPPYIVGVATLIKYNDAARGEAQEAIAYNLLPEHKAFDWQIGYGAGGLESGIGLIAIPSLLKDLDATGVTTEIAIQNVVPKPGFTDFAIFIYDQNGLLDYICEKLNEKQIEYINLQTWGYVNPGFKGSAIISAVFWEHDVLRGDGFFLRNLVGLAAVSVERTGTPLGEDVPGDEAAGSRGIPFREQDLEDAEFEFGFQGHRNGVPLCPGLPYIGPKPGEEPAWICPPDLIEGTMGTTWNWGDVATGGPHSSRIYRDGVPSQCTPPKTCPGGGYPGGGYVDCWYFDNPDGMVTCVTITSGTGDCWSGYNAHEAMFTGRYDPSIPFACDPAPDVTYLGDPGSSPSGPGQAWGAEIPSGIDKWSFFVGNVYSAANCNYSYTIEGFACQ